MSDEQVDRRKVRTIRMLTSQAGSPTLVRDRVYEMPTKVANQLAKNGHAVILNEDEARTARAEWENRETAISPAGSGIRETRGGDAA